MGKSDGRDLQSRGESEKRFVAVLGYLFCPPSNERLGARYYVQLVETVLFIFLPLFLQVIFELKISSNLSVTP